MTETLQVSAKKRDYTIHIHSYGVTDTMVTYLAMPQMIPKFTDLYWRITELGYHADYSLVTVEIEDWNRELSPWEFIEPVGNMSFAGEGEQLLLDLEQSIIPCLCEQLQVKQDKVSFMIAGYSLAGLFSLWALYQTKLFQAAVSCSGSLWYPGFLEYAMGQELKGDCDIYLSLGRREEKVQNPYMAKVGRVTKKLYKNYQTDARVKHTVLEWNEGNHFKEPLERTAKGIACAMKWQWQNRQGSD